MHAALIKYPIFGTIANSHEMRGSKVTCRAKTDTLLKETVSFQQIPKKELDENTAHNSSTSL
jgi:hypothetical protein